MITGQNLVTCYDEIVRIPTTSHLAALFTLIYTILAHPSPPQTECILLFNNRKGSCSGWFGPNILIFHIKKITWPVGATIEMNFWVFDSLKRYNFKCFKNIIFLIQNLCMSQGHPNIDSSCILKLKISIVHSGNDYNKVLHVRIEFMSICKGCLLHLNCGANWSCVFLMWKICKLILQNYENGKWIVK